MNLDRLRAGYATLVGELRTGGFGPPAAGAWSAERIAAHAVRNTELLLATTRALVAGGPVAGPVRYDNADAMRPATLDGYTTAGVPVLADRVERLAGELYPFVPLLNRGRPMAHVRVVDGGEVLLDEAQGWLGVLNALWVR